MQRAGDRDDPASGEMAQREASLLAKVRDGRLAASIQARADPAPRVLGRYRLIERLGRGGVGEVWRGEHLDLGIAAAIKVLAAESGADPDVRRRFLREAKAAAAIDHPHVVRILDFGSADDGTSYLVMELVGRRSLRDLAVEGPLPWPRVRTILAQVASAMAHAHASGVLHLDLKPSNVMLIDDVPADHCKVIDFGLARCLSAELYSGTLTRSGQVLGSPAYMSPEQFRGERSDARSDIYSLGCIAFHLLAGRKPYEGATPSECMYQHLMAPLPTLGPVIDAGGSQAAVEAVIVRALDKDPERRFPSMTALLRELERDARATRAVLAVGAPRRRRSRKALAAVALGSVVVLGTAIVTLASSGREPADPPPVVEAASVAVPPDPGPPSIAPASRSPANAPGVPATRSPVVVDGAEPRTGASARSSRSAGGRIGKARASGVAPAPSPSSSVPPASTPEPEPAPEPNRPFTPRELPDPFAAGTEPK